MDFDVKKIAKLAKIDITVEEEKVLENNIQDIIKMLDKLNEVDLKIDKNKKLENILLDDLGNMEYRDDVEKKSMSNKDLVMNAPKAVAGCIVVPRIIE